MENLFLGQHVPIETSLRAIKTGRSETLRPTGTYIKGYEPGISTNSAKQQYFEPWYGYHYIELFDYKGTVFYSGYSTIIKGVQPKDQPDQWPHIYDPRIIQQGYGPSIEGGDERLGTPNTAYIKVLTTHKESLGAHEQPVNTGRFWYYGQLSTYTK